ncbi:MAG: MFS transporter [Verrucomicrobiota bacterium]
MNPTTQAPAPGSRASGGKHPLYYVGTLVYSRGGLAWLFMWLLWGDFCFMMMEGVVPSIIPLRLRELEAPNWVLGVILITIPSILNVLLNPIISTASDRHRGRFGRRIPFMLFTVPFVTIALCIMGLSTELGKLLHGLVGTQTGWSTATLTTLVIAGAMVLFKFSDMFVNTVFWYFFNDVVPENVMAHFLGLFRIVGAAAGILYSYFIYQFALSHLREIFLGAAGLYFLGFTAMCLLVKEGKYPPTPSLAKRGDILGMVKTYVRECLQHKIYRYLFLHNMVWNLASAVGIFTVLLNLSLGLTLDQLGKIAAAVGVANMILTYPASALADRFHPLRAMVWIKTAIVITAPLGFVWIFTRYAPEVNFRILIVLQVIALPMTLIYNATSLPMLMRILPKDRFGQFCSFNAICTAGAAAVSGIAVGAYFDFMRKLFPDATWGKDFCYRMAPLWSLPFLILGLLLLILLYRSWKELGGLSHYVPPGSEPPANPIPQPHKNDISR